jgi:hypothetical protein
MEVIFVCERCGRTATVDPEIRRDRAKVRRWARLAGGHEYCPDCATIDERAESEARDVDTRARINAPGPGEYLPLLRIFRRRR